jgi:hypothetical protein
MFILTGIKSHGACVCSRRWKMCGGGGGMSKWISSPFGPSGRPAALTRHEFQSRIGLLWIWADVSHELIAIILSDHGENIMTKHVKGKECIHPVAWQPVTIQRESLMTCYISFHDVNFPVFSRIPFQSYLLQNGALRWTFYAISHALHAQIVNTKPSHSHIRINTLSVLIGTNTWLRDYATSRKVVGSSPDAVIEFFANYLILPAALGPGVYSASNRNEYQKQENHFSGE